jgi:peroxiredoxin
MRLVQPRAARRRSIVLSLACLAAAAAFAAEPARLHVGRPAPDFSLPGSDGATHSLAQAGSAKGTVVIFLSTRCPVSNAYNDRMAEIASRYQPQGVRFLGVDANKEETPAEIASHAKSHNWSFPVLKDAGNKVADLYGASVTPEVFLIDPSGALRYHGRIDDSQDPEGVKSRDLGEALDALLAGREIQHKEAKAFGCSIKRG